MSCGYVSAGCGIHAEGVLSTKLIPVHLPSKTFLMNRARGMATSLSSSTKRLYETTLGEEMAKMFAYHSKIEVLETPVTRIMEQYHNKHDFGL